MILKPILYDWITKSVKLPKKMIFCLFSWNSNYFYLSAFEFDSKNSHYVKRLNKIILLCLKAVVFLHLYKAEYDSNVNFCSVFIQI